MLSFGNTSDLILELRVHESFSSYWVAVSEPSHKLGTGPSLVSLAPSFSLSSRNTPPRGALRDETKNGTIATQNTLRVCFVFLASSHVFSWSIGRLFDFCAASFCSGNFTLT